MMRLAWSLGSVTLLLGCLLCAPALAADDTVRLTNGEWRPFLSQNLPRFGPVSQIVEEAFELSGVKVEYGFFPWKRAFAYAKAGRWDGTIVWSYSEERAEVFHYSDPVLISTEVFFHRKDEDLSWNTLSDLKGKVIGAEIGYFYGEAFERAEKNGVFSVVRIAEPKKNFDKLLKGRIDAAVSDVYVGYSFLKNEYSPEQADQVTHNPRPVNQGGLYLMLSRKVPGNEALLKRFNEGLHKLHEQGRVRRILDDVFGRVYTSGRVVDGGAVPSP